MILKELRSLLRTMPTVEETVWHKKLVFWVGDKAIVGKMFALLNLDQEVKEGKPPALVLSFSAGVEGSGYLLELDGVMPAPYLARIHWVALQHWAALSAHDLGVFFRRAHTITSAKLP